jgi:hypothetical protein
MRNDLFAFLDGTSRFPTISINIQRYSEEQTFISLKYNSNIFGIGSIPIPLQCGELATPLVDGQTSWVFCITLVKSLYISCHVSLTKLVLSDLLLRLLPQW